MYGARTAVAAALLLSACARIAAGHEESRSPGRRAARSLSVEEHIDRAVHAFLPLYGDSIRCHFGVGDTSACAGHDAGHDHHGHGPSGHHSHHGAENGAEHGASQEQRRLRRLGGDVPEEGEPEDYRSARPFLCATPDIQANLELLRFSQSHLGAVGDVFGKVGDPEFLEGAHLAAERLVIPLVVYHVITDGANGNLTDGQLALQQERLNSAFAPRIRFESHVRRDYVDANVFGRGCRDFGLMYEFKIANAVQGAINIYTLACSGGVFGYAYLPYGPAEHDPIHGAVIDYDTIDGAMCPGGCGGGTAVHEVGHMFGLLHTFENSANVFGGERDYGCDCTWGDLVDDTPPEKFPTGSADCFLTANSCREDLFEHYFGTVGNDPNDNFMGYAADACMTRFTPGQFDRMLYTLATTKPNLVSASLGTSDDHHCIAGSFFDGERCRLCPEGTYQDEFGQDSCKECPGGGRVKGSPDALIADLYTNVIQCYESDATCVDTFIGDGYCDIVNNNEACSFDGGDCCSGCCSDSTSFLCGNGDPGTTSFQACLDATCASSAYDGHATCTNDHRMGDGFCDDENNFRECYYDGGDCCGECCQGDACSTADGAYAGRCKDPECGLSSIAVSDTCQNFFDTPWLVANATGAGYDTAAPTSEPPSGPPGPPTPAPTSLDACWEDIGHNDPTPGATGRYVIVAPDGAVAVGAGSSLLRLACPFPTSLNFALEVVFTIVRVPEDATRFAQVFQVSDASDATLHRSPAAWLYPGSTRLHVRQADIANANAGCDPVEGLPLGTPIRLQIVGRSYLPSTVALFHEGSGAYIAGCSWTPTTLLYLSRAQAFLAASPASADVHIESMTYIDLNINSAPPAPVVRPPPGPIQTIIGKAERVSPSRGQVLGVLWTSAHYSLHFRFRVHGRVSGWGQVFQAGDGGSCCDGGNRVPALFLHPGSSRLHFQQADRSSGRAGCDPAGEMPTETDLTFTAHVLENAESYVAVYKSEGGNVALLTACSWRAGALDVQQGARVFASLGASGASPANVTLWDMEYVDLAYPPA